MTPTVNALRKLVNETLVLPPLLNVWEWGESRRRLTKEVSAVTGPYRVATTPYAKEPQESFLDPEVQVTVLCAASRLFKTESINNLIGCQIERNPSNIIFVWPTIDRGKLWSKQFLDPMIRSTPYLRNKFKVARSKDADNTILSKRFPGGTISILGSNSTAGFRGPQAPMVVCDEADDYVNGPEGDPVLLAFKRTENHPDSIQVVSSTPTLKGTSRIWSWLEQSDFRKWFVPCYHCGAHILLMRANLRWPEGKPELCEYECDQCARMLNDIQRYDMVMNGIWKPTLPFNGIRGYWLNGLNSPFPPKKGFVNKLHQFAKEIDTAKAQGEAAMITLTNTFDAECYEIISQSADAMELIKRCEKYGSEVPNTVLMLTAGADVQQDRIEALLMGWGEDEQSWCIEYRVFTGNTEESEVWTEFDQWLTQSRAREDGVKLKIAQTFVDSGFESKTVYGFTRKREFRKVWAVKGMRFGPICSGKPSRRNELSAGLFIIGTNSAKTTIFQRLKIAMDGPRKIHYPIGQGFTEEWFEGFTAEHLVMEKMGGKLCYVWKKKDENGRNEPLDCFVYALAAQSQLRPNWAAVKSNIEARLAMSKSLNEQPAKPEAQPEKASTFKVPETREPRQKRRGGFVGSWRR